MPQANSHTCKHNTLKFDPSSHAAVVGYKRPTEQQRAAATTRSGHVKTHQDIKIPDPGTYPASLVLPDDDLAIDPKYPAQSLRAWLGEKDRNPVTQERKTIYVAGPPDVDPEVEFVKGWCIPRATAGGNGTVDQSQPDVMDVVRYLQAFYHSMHVKLLPTSSAFRFAAWDNEDDIEPPEESPEPPPKGATKKRGKVNAKSKTKPKPKPRTAKSPSFIALQTSTEATRIRTRYTSEDSSSFHYPSQLNLSDLLDATIALPPPPDAYALLLLVSHDLYEDDDDDFVCGRAYGGSRVAVVSSARYDPRLDSVQDVHPDGEQHAWPGSCCAAFMDDMCSREGRKTSKPGGVSKGVSGDVLLQSSSQQASPMMKAITAAAAAAAQPLLPPHLPSPPEKKNSSSRRPQHQHQPTTPKEHSTLLWLSRICKTASHELGHCFGIDHCVYYACVMQGTAGLAEDARQPPYLCPIDETKLAVAIAAIFAASSTSAAVVTSTSAPVAIDVDGTGAGAETGIVIRAGRKRERSEMAGSGTKVKAKAKAKAKGRGGESESGGGEIEMGKLEIWKQERRERLRGFCQEMVRAGGGKEAAGSFWRAFDAWLEGVGGAERGKGKFGEV